MTGDRNKHVFHRFSLIKLHSFGQSRGVPIDGPLISSCSVCVFRALTTWRVSTRLPYTMAFMRRHDCDVWRFHGRVVRVTAVSRRDRVRDVRVVTTPPHRVSVAWPPRSRPNHRWTSPRIFVISYSLQRRVRHTIRTVRESAHRWWRRRLKKREDRGSLGHPIDDYGGGGSNGWGVKPWGLSRPRIIYFIIILIYCLRTHKRTSIY